MKSQYNITKMRPMHQTIRSTLFYGMLKNREVAVKFIPKKYNMTERPYTETDVLKMLQKSKNVVKYIDTIENENNTYIVMEWIHGMNLKEYIKQLKKPLEEKQVRIMAKQLMDALLACNNANMIYGDVKLENIMIDPFGNIKLIDFGCTRMIGTVYNSYIGTPVYFSPEMFEQVFIPEYDVWGAGIIMYYLACGEHPFVDRKPYDLTDLKEMIYYSPMHFDHSAWKKWSKEGKDLIIGMLEKDHLKRMNIHNVIEDKWFSI